MNKESTYKKINIFRIIVLFLFSFAIMFGTLFYSTILFNKGKLPLFISYFKDMKLIALNLIPILIFILLVDILFNKLWLSFLLSSSLFMTLAIINKIKLTYRNDPFTFMDVRLISESLNMKDKYGIGLDKTIILTIVLIVLGTIIVKILEKKLKLEIKLSGKFKMGTIFILALSVHFFFNKIYFNEELYNSIGNMELINRWVDNQRYQAKGFVYPFTYSIKETKTEEMKDYNEDIAKKALAKYDKKDIEDEKKVNVIAIMLESYTDLSEYDGIEFDKSVYGYFNELKKNSIHGSLITNTYGGGTRDAERGFMTGTHDPINENGKYLRYTNSILWYFRDQGYRVVGSHPSYGWFYNRIDVNRHLGMQDFKYYENKYVQLQSEGIMEDIPFFKTIIKDYEKDRDKNIPHFSFSVTYQNHGPYEQVEYDKDQFLKWKNGYDKAHYNEINNYFRGIAKTDKAIKNMINYFEKEKEPTVVILFGDHKPAFGQEYKGYKMLGIDVEKEGEEGLRNMHETPYIVWGNEAAKKVTGKSFKAKGEIMSPNFLLASVVDYMGYGGDEFIQYINDLNKLYTVNHVSGFKTKDGFVNIDDASKELKEKFKEYQNVQYYYKNNFKYKEIQNKGQETF